MVQRETQRETTKTNREVGKVSDRDKSQRDTSPVMTKSAGQGGFLKNRLVLFHLAAEITSKDGQDLKR